MALVLTLVARPARGLALPLALRLRASSEKLFISWVGLRGAVSIFLAAIPMLAGVPNATAYFNIAFFVVLVSMLVQGSTLTTAARRLGVALRQTTHAVSRVEIDIPGQTEQEIVGYPVTADSVILGLSRLPAWARVRDGGAQGAHPRRGRRRARSGRATTATSSSAATALPRLDTPLPREPRRGAPARAAVRRAADPRRDPGRPRSSSSTASTSASTCPRATLADWAAARLGGRPALDAVLRDPRRQAGGAPARVGPDRQHGPAARRAAAGRAGREAARAPRGGGRRAERPPALACPRLAAAAQGQRSDAARAAQRPS